MIVLYRKQATGCIGTWRIWQDGQTIRWASAQVEHGAEIPYEEHVTVNMSGRTLQQQIQSRIDSRISRMLDKGYKPSRDEALKGQTNQLGLYRPMLAQRYDKVRVKSFAGSTIQTKLDGHRCLITRQNDEVLAYSRQGKPILTIPHILDPISHTIQEGVTLDGELYLHGYPLQTLASWIKRAQPDTKRLLWVGYDSISHKSQKDRYMDLLENTPSDHPSIMRLPCEEWTSEDDMLNRFASAKANGYEGLIIRLPDYGYEDGKRSKSLIKVKSQFDGEVTVIDIFASKDGWAVCTCLFDGKKFNVSAPGSIPEKIKVLENKDEYIGKRLTIEYACLTNAGLPFHCVALRFREDV